VGLTISAMRQVPDRLAQLDARRRWARARAPVWFGLGVVIMTVALAGTGLAVLAMLGRLVSLVLDRPLRDLPVWGWAGWVAAGFALAGVALAVASVVFSVLRHGADRVLRDVGAVRLDNAPTAADDLPVTRLRNVVEALCLGLGVEQPRLAVVDDPAANALSVSGWSDETLAVTSGLLQLDRDEIEAVAAHELACLHARDSRWVTAAAASLGRARGIAHVLAGFGGLLVVLFFAGLEAEVFLITPLLGGIVIGGFAMVVDLRMSAAQNRLRAESDEIADVAAVLLARNPAALASVCHQLSYRPRRVRRTSWRADHLWFAPLPAPKEKKESSGGGGDDPGPWSLRWWRRSSPTTDGPAPQVDPESAREVAETLTSRATAAYQAAGVPLPPAPATPAD
jgi:Zn-dependent protease with chaperone function